MPYNQITARLTIAPGPDPAGPSPQRIRQTIEDSLIADGYTVNWLDKRHQPYHLNINNGLRTIDLYIYAWRIINGGRVNLVNEKRIEISSTASSVGFSRPITLTQKTLLLGLYDSPSGTPVFAAWDAAANATRGKQKSCQVNVNDLLSGLTSGIHQTTDSHNNTIYTFSPDFLSDYIDLLSPGNTLALPSTIPTAGPISTTSSPSPSLSALVRKASLPARRARTLRTTASLLSSINRLTQTEKDYVVKQRVGHGLFKELLMNKYGCKCALCNITTESMLIASHIKRWSDCSTDAERLDDNNGLLLCPHHDALFDKHLITFDEHTGALIVSPTLSTTEQTVLDIASIPSITITSRMAPYMGDHHAKLKV